MHTEHIRSKTFIEAKGGVLVVTPNWDVHDGGLTARDEYAEEAYCIKLWLEAVFCNRTLAALAAALEPYRSKA